MEWPLDLDFPVSPGTQKVKVFMRAGCWGEPRYQIDPYHGILGPEVNVALQPSDSGHRFQYDFFV